MAEAKKKQYINRKTGQITTDSVVAKNTGANEEYNPNPTIRTFSRPTGTPTSSNVETTNMNAQDKQRISTNNALIGQELAKRKLANQVNQGVTQEILKSNVDQGVAQETQQEIQSPVSDTPNLENDVINKIDATTNLQTKDKGMLPSVANFLELPRQQGIGEGVSSVVAGSLGLGAEILNGIWSAISGNTPTKVKAEISIYDDAMAALDKEIQGVSLGTFSEKDAARDIKNSEEAISRLEGYQKGLGRVNLRYWQTKGKELETQILKMKEYLDSAKTDLDIAKQNNIIRQAATNYGLT